MNCKEFICDNNWIIIVKKNVNIKQWKKQLKIWISMRNISFDKHIEEKLIYQVYKRNEYVLKKFYVKKDSKLHITEVNSSNLQILSLLTASEYMW